ncbi:MAG: outer membrane beta-barrel protein [Polaribacter sp.]|nr:outer membrane beta-barrel protein [Polaribacter sp.]
MKKIVLLIILAFGLNHVSTAQIHFGVKAGVNYNDNGNLTLSGTFNDAVAGADAKSGFHAGIWFRGKLPIIGLYIRPEIVYTEAKSAYLYKAASIPYNFQKIDVPVLLGKKILGFATVFIGPSFQYVLGSDFEISTVNEVSLDAFSVGIQSGFGVEFGKVGIDVRWERGLSKTEASFFNVTDSSTFQIDNRTSQIILGLSYRL